MKSRIAAVLLIVGAAAAPIHAAEAGILSNKLGQAAFLGKVMKGKIIDGSRKVASKVVTKAVVACMNSKFCGRLKLP